MVESIPLRVVLQIMIEIYEKENHPMDDLQGKDALIFLMEQQGLKQKDLAEVASQGVLSEILSGKRHLTLRHIKVLSKRFNVSPAVFIDDE